MNAINQIQECLPSLSRSQKEIAQYIIRDPSHVLDLSIHEMAEEMGVSASSITRFCRKMGFESLRDMRIEIARAADEKAAEDIRESISWSGAPESLAKYYLGHVTEVCEKTLRINHFDNLKEIAQKICDADVIYLYGIGASSLAARNLMGKLIKLHLRCVYDFDSNQAFQMAMSSTDNDLAIAFSYSGTSRDVVQAAKNSRKKGCPVVAITREGSSILRQHSSYCLFVPSVEQVTRVTTLFTNYCQFLLVDTLFLLCAQILDVDPSGLLKEYRQAIPGWTDGSSPNESLA
jgi:DNA-binding MurR/RpiR family transcriptional regulator